MKTLTFDDTNWQIVPKEVTEEMQLAYDMALRDAVMQQSAMVRETGSHNIRGWEIAYMAMLAAAPVPNA